MKKNKKTIISVTVVVVLLLIGLLTYFILTKEDKDSTLTLIEKQWIESNKNNVIDMSIINDIPILSYNGEGLIVDFLNDLNSVTNLSFNKVSYTGNDIKSEYAFKLTDEITDKDILVYEDNYAIITKNALKYNSLDDLANLKIGVLNSELDKVNNYLYNSKISYRTFENNTDLITEFNKEDSELDAIVLLKTFDLKQILDNNYNIAYNITEYKKYFVLTLGSEERLNTILTKYYNKWKSEKYESSYNGHLTDDYFTFNKIDDSQEVKFRSKRYVYGFINNAPYDTVLNGKLAGINNQFLGEFSNFSNAEISYKEYDSIEKLLEAFNKNEIDFFYGINKDTKYNLDVYNTVPVYDNKMVILSHASNKLAINSIKSLNNSSVLVLNNSKMQDYLTKAGISVLGYNNDDELVSNVKNDSVVIMDLNNYNYHAKNNFGSYYITVMEDFENASFVIRDINDNKVFSDLLDFYISFNSSKPYIAEGLGELLLVDMTPYILKNIAIVLGVIIIILLIVLVIIKLRPNRKKKVNFSKEDKLRYIDSLTSLKNRNYLNDNMEKWDESEIYPQTIVIIDLNNIAYINDNYGHPEGDAVIEQAANILIVNQLENTDIIRTNGNEFLIYMVGYDEKQVITYMRKLGKELKELKHGFGAAMGYSMVTDAIKTIDDAINEATLDMRNNKEEASNN